MTVIFVLLPVALLLATAGVAAFLWAARSGQFDDLDTPGLRIFHDDPPPPARSAAGSSPARKERAES